MTPTQTDIGRIQRGNGRPAWLAHAAAASLRRVDHARGKTTPVNWAGRSEAEQFSLVKKYYVRATSGEFKYDGSWWRKKPGSRVVVARPTTSPHEPGNAVDTDEWTVPGFVALMAEHGWIRTLKSEPWHFVYFASRDKHRNDPAPPATGGASTGGTKPAPARPTRRRKPMSTGVVHTNGTADKTRRGAVIDTESGQFSPFGWFPVSYANGVAKGFGLEASAPITDGHYDQLKRDQANLRAANGKLAVDIADEDIPKIGG